MNIVALKVSTAMQACWYTDGIYVSVSANPAMQSYVSRKETFL